MAVWETEDESTGPVASLPTPAEPPHRALSRTVSRGSRKSARSITPPGKKGKSRSPTPGTGDKSERGSKRSSRDVSTDENISILDPRRFTPTLHASLVSEILSLRRDQEEKLKIIEGLESSLQTVREETESLRATLLSTTKESRSLKRQLSLLEGGTSSALGELARERDEAIESAAETKKRLEATQKKLRTQEEDSERVHQQWAKEKDEWEEEKRKYERRIHVAESRLKVVLDEVAAFQAAQASGLNGAANGAESDAEDGGKDNDAASVRTMSMTNSIRFSAANSILKANGNSLADELGFDGGFDEESDYGGRESVLSKGHSRNFSRESAPFRTHRRHRSNESLARPGSSISRGKLAFNAAALERLEDGIIKEDDELPPPAPKPSYVDTGIQYSPPPSPKVVPIKPSTPEPSPFLQRSERPFDVDSPPRADHEVEANQRRKRVHVGHPIPIKTPGLHNLMVNGSSQTVEEPLSPPKTPKTPFQEIPPTPKPAAAPDMVSVSTQTDDLPPPLQPSFLGLPMPIPSISIIPPTSRPSTPREPRLPQLCKDFGCQVNLPSTLQTTSSSMQTEEIRVDKRLDKLPPHLHPSAITSRPSSPANGAADYATEDTRQFTPIPGNLPPRNPRRLDSKRSLSEVPSSPPMVSSSILEEAHDSYPGNNDDGPLSSQKAPMRRPPRISSLFAGFEGNSSDEADEFMDADLSDSEYRTALSAPKPPSNSSRGAKRNSVGTVTSSENALSPKLNARFFARGLESPEGVDSVAYQMREMRDAGFGRRGSRRGGRSLMFGTKSSVMRRTAMIQSGIASHQRARSPSLADPSEPPFPIPTRASSRKPPVSSSAPSDGRASPSRGFDAWPRRGSSRSHYRANSIRKVRSAAALPRNQRYRRRGSRSPPPFSVSTEAPESPRLPPLPSNGSMTSRTRDGYRFKTHRSQPSTTTANTTDTGAQSRGGAKQPPTVVDAIAQTMVGEWMFKYVRRRKSFSMPDSKGGDDNSNDRHKRWVWLAPYERAILWSSKQPASGSALLGKSGRKLTIQSVLDVKDDNPPPKGVTQLFNRSILILTPERALKFTATNAERHYIWLTSLSFLAHSNQAIPDALLVPQPKPLVDQYELPKPKRRPIRDSIRLTKAKTAVIKSDPVTAESAQTDSAPPSVPTYRPPPLPDVYTLPTHARDLSRDAAEPPAIPRFSDRGAHMPVHGRKRSNTGGHVPPPLSFRGFSGPAGSGGAYHASTNSTAGNSIMTAGSSDIYSNAGASAVTGSSGMTWATGSMRTSEASSRPSAPVQNNFFDAIGTVRMEAFISPLSFSGRFDEFSTSYEHQQQVLQPDDFRRATRRRSKELRRRASRNSRQRDSYHSRTTRATDELDDWYLRDDPFKGF
ncbi:uncharacterized protein THITE_2106394 [Thermothielavioides terrestris NRRL 8126]|uniref:Pleckstrin homology domain-containing protein n=1 Tax=Thermothielavioides terrestris (strain ATCC 38088 / NRRL 8126) TaxID=578455 RepID=G2QXB1_THETT|nr:uncharacterized protein THITE_2106394 [Thermothielavioides terrestris NRRL 8126]AEO62332.1 hypothetical protein THITE_2106394 [Thermothielavioides terrestris NRRL 8126]